MAKKLLEKPFELISEYTPSGDQPRAIDEIVEGIPIVEKLEKGIAYDMIELFELRYNRKPTDREEKIEGWTGLLTEQALITTDWAVLIAEVSRYMDTGDIQQGKKGDIPYYWRV